MPGTEAMALPTTSVSVSMIAMPMLAMPMSEPQAVAMSEAAAMQETMSSRETKAEAGNANDIPMKHLFENRFPFGQSKCQLEKL